MKQISVIGGDKVIVELIKLINGEYDVLTYGLEEAEDLEGVRKVNLDTALSSDTIIFSIPFLNSSNEVFMPFSNNKLSYDEIRDRIAGKTIVTSRVEDNIRKELEDKNCKVIDVIKTDELNIINAISTAEGVLVMAIEETEFCMLGAKVLVLGFGRVGKMICKTFKGVGADVSCEARKTKDLTWIEAHGYKAVDLKNLEKELGNYDVIINTVPSMMLDRKRLEYVKKDALLIDIATSPKGIDSNASKEMGIETRWAFSIPSKVAPKTYANGIKRVLEINEI